MVWEHRLIHYQIESIKMRPSNGAVALCVLLVITLSCAASAERPVEWIEPEAQPGKLAASNTTCTVCEFAMSVLQGLISENTTQEELIKLLDDFCEKVMPKTIKQECEDFVANYGEAVIQLIDQKIDPQLICREIKLCPHTYEEAGSDRPLPRI